MHPVARIAVVAGMLAVFVVPVRAQEAGTVDVVKVSGILDRPIVEFAIATIDALAAGGSQLVILQLDSPGAVSDDIHGLLDLVGDPPLPLAIWVGPAPAEAYGGAGQLLSFAPLRAAAPRALVGYLSPTVAGKPDVRPPAGPSELAGKVVSVDRPIRDLVDIVEPSLPQLVASLDGVEVVVEGEAIELRTLEESTDADGSTVVHPSETRFWEPGLATRVLRIGLNPDAAFFLLAVGLAVVAFEFYALGPGVAAGVGAISILLASYGLVTMPLNIWALLLCVVGVVGMTVQFQRSRPFGLGTALGAVLLLVGGLNLTDASPQFGPTWWAILLTVAVVVFFFVLALPAVTRARLTTQTIGRDYLVGQSGVAESDFSSGEGTAEVDGARWRATAHRESGLTSGDELVVVGVQGVFLSVEPKAKGAKRN